MTSRTKKEDKAVEKIPQPLRPPLSKQQQVAVDAAKTNTKNDGSHIEKQREARLAQFNQEEC